MNSAGKRIIVLLFLILLGAIFFAITKGAVKISFFDLLSEKYRQIVYLRLMRVSLAILVGAGLSVCGTVLQATLKNPLADPYLLGTSSGAGLGAILAIVFGVSAVFLPFSAFSGALVSIILVYYLSRSNGKIPVESLILSGVVVGVTFSGVIVFLVSVSRNEAMHAIAWWLLGSLQVYDLKLLAIVGVVVCFGSIFMFSIAQDLNALSIGEEEAVHLGIKSESIKKIVFVITSLVTGAIVSVTGMIGFVGLIVPHMMRLIVGPNHRILIPTACLGGAIFLVISDALSRSLLAPIEIPIGVITSLIGAPLFIVLLKLNQKKIVSS